MAAKPALALPGQQINYGSGKEVSDETIADAGEPMEIRWLGGRYLELPRVNPSHRAPVRTARRGHPSPAPRHQ